MKRLLICPGERPALAALSQGAPLGNVPFLGQSLLEYWLSRLAADGVQEVLVLAHDRPEEVKRLVNGGERWGLSVQVIAESRELAPAQAALKYTAELGGNPAEELEAITVLDHLPGLPEHRLLTGYAAWFAGLCAWMPHALTPDRVGVREVRPGIWVGSHSRISPAAKVVAPCWIGDHVFVGADAAVGPGAIIENGAFIEPETQITASCVGPDTLVGGGARLSQAFAWGETLMNWATETSVRAPVGFLLCALRRPRAHTGQGVLRRWLEAYARHKAELALVWKNLPQQREG